jgi:hypothetical protein
MTATTADGQSFPSRRAAGAGARIGGRLAARAGLALLGPVGAAIGLGLLANDAYELTRTYNKSLSKTDDKPTEECTGECADAKEKAEQEAVDTHDNIEDFEGRPYEDVECELDEKLRDNGGWSKMPLRSGDGARYTSPDGKRQVRINRGYPGGNARGPSDGIPSGPYISRPSTGTRIPLHRPGNTGV